MNALKVATRVVRRPGYLSAKVGTGLVLMYTDGGTYIDLNETATRIWELTECETTVAELVDRLVQEFGVDPNECTASVCRYLVDAQSVGLVEVLNDTPRVDAS
jgi:hypothetical protein